MWCRRNAVFRSAAPDSYPSVLAALITLGITHVYDLRSCFEVQHHGDWTNQAASSSLQRVSVPVFQDEDCSPEAIALRYQTYTAADSTRGFVTGYRSILRAAGPAFGTVLAHLATPVPSPFLIHCTGGQGPHWRALRHHPFSVRCR